MAYEVINTLNNEMFTVKTITEISKILGVSHQNISYHLRNNNGEYSKGNWIVRNLRPKVIKDETEIKTFADAIAWDKQKMREEIQRRKKMMEWKCKESFKDEEISSEVSKMIKWEEHCSKTCIKSKDEKVWLPKSIIEEFPSLSNYTLPKSMQ